MNGTFFVKLIHHLFFSVDDFVGCIDVAIVEDSKDIFARSINSFSKQKVSKAVHVIVQCEFIFSTLEDDKQIFTFTVNNQLHD